MLPERRSIKWLLVLFVTLVLNVLVGVLAIASVSIHAGINMFESAVIVIFIFSFGINIFVNIIGAFGGKRFFLLSEIALLSGTGMATASSCIDSAGWEYFVQSYDMKNNQIKFNSSMIQQLLGNPLRRNKILSELKNIKEVR